MVVTMWTLTETLPSVKDYNRIRQTAGWGTYTEDFLQRCLPNSLYCVCAIENDTCIGMARVIGDGGLVYYIQDVVVIPEYQRQGIGTELMKAVMCYISSNASHNSIIGLMAAKGKEDFYTRFGFTVHPNENQGSGMTLYWQDSP